MAINPLQIPGYAAPAQADFTPLSQLGQIYRQARARQALSNLQRGPDGSVDTAPLYASGDLSLANLASQFDRNKVLDQRDSRDYQFRVERAAQDQRNADRSYGLQVRQADRLEQTPEESAAERAKAARANGVDPTTPAGRAYVLTGRLPEGDQNFAQVVAQRQQAAQANGLDPSSPGYQSFVLTGKMPREDAQPLTATDKKAILEADEGVMTARSAIDALKQAKSLSKQAFEGPTAGMRGYAASFLGEKSDIGKAGAATLDLENTITSNALSQLKAIFGGAPTEGERKILLDIQGSAKLPDNVRQRIYDRALALAERRLKMNEDRATELRGGTFYKPGAKPSATVQTPQTAAQPASGVVDWRTYFGGQ